MGAYEKAFCANSDVTSLFSLSTTNGSAAYVAGIGIRLDKTSGSWGETGLRWGAPTARAIAKGDKIYFECIAEEINTTAGDATTWLAGLRHGSATNLSSDPVPGFWCNTTGGAVRVIGKSSGIGSDSTASGNIQVNDLIKCEIECNVVTGFVTVRAKGGALGGTYQTIVAGSTDMTAFNNFMFMMNLFAGVAPDSRCALVYYEWGNGTLDARSVQGITATAISSTEIEIDCDAFNLADTYKIYKDGIEIDEVAHGAFPYTVSGLTPSTEYDFNIVAVGDFEVVRDGCSRHG